MVYAAAGVDRGVQGGAAVSDTQEQPDWWQASGEDVPPNIDEATIGCTVLAIEEGTDLGGYQRATDADTCTVLEADSSGDIQVEVAVTSPYEETSKVQTWLALDAPGPMRFECDTEVADFVATGESFRITPR